MAVLEVGEGAGVGGVPRLGGAGLRHVELVEEHLLDLLRRAEVDLAADDPERLGGDVVRAHRELGRQLGELGVAHGHPGELHRGEHREHGQLDLGEHTQRALVERVAHVASETPDEPGLSRDPELGVADGHELVRVARRQLFAQLAVDELRQGAVARRVGAHQPRGDLAVEGEAGEGEPGSAERLELRLGAVHQLGRIGRQPPLERRVSGAAGAPGQRQALVLRRHGDGDRQPVDGLELHGETAGIRRGRAGEPGLELVVEEGEGGGRLRRLGRRPRLGGATDLGPVEALLLQHPVEQGAELEPTEEVAHGLLVDGPPRQVFGDHGQLDVADERVEPTVADRVLGVVAQVLPHDALDLVAVLEDAVEAAVLLQPLERRLLAHLGDAGQVVARLAHERRDLGVLIGTDAVLVEDLRLVVGGEVADALA